MLILNVKSQTATVTVFSQDGEKFWVIMNDIKQNEKAMTNVKVTGLSLPNYRLKIIFDDEKIPVLDKNIMTKNHDNVLCDQAYVLKKDIQGNFVMHLNSFEPTKEIATTVEPNQVVVPFRTVETIEKPIEQKNPNEKTTNITSTTITTTTTSYGNDSKELSDREYPDRNHNDHGHNESLPQLPPSPPKPTFNLPGYNGPIGCELPFSIQDFDDAKKSISSKSFEDSKLAIAEQIVAANCLLTTQVKEIMMLFSFEDSKLQFAKYAYKYTYDIGNYYKVNDAFTFEMSINDLNEYISSQKK